ncbi:N-formylglutamate deformylase [Labrys okinawensis]|uniref:N-formylglutamate deformylase n=1 Tax=Labrys okinawensis TaxID=346911 RepID=A0A2S9QFE6_9HYPH|nr:N-formylglutamate deformylase [Labrys okinawensis]PRH88020.1 N-formylglutamate deformylase [Labrys okinawensis]
MSRPDWLEIRQGQAPLLVSLPHTGTEIPAAIEARLVSPWLARKDTDWWIETLYDFAAGLDATIVRTPMSRTVVDVNRDPSGVSLYPGQATTELCPTTSFDGEPLYKDGEAPGAAEVAERRALWFDPYHQALADEVARLRGRHRNIVVYDCHSIRSVIPRLFEGTLPQFNIGTNGGVTCHPALAETIEALCRSSGRETVMNGRFKGGFITRSLGQPDKGVHAVQMELACRSYIDEPLGPVGEANWPVAFNAAYAQPLRETLGSILNACLVFARALK